MLLLSYVGDIPMIDDKRWLEFISEADTYNGPLTVGELFCKLFEVNDTQLSQADNDSAWQLIVYKYRTNRD
jgi:hypothetical protein